LVIDNKKIYDMPPRESGGETNMESAWQLGKVNNKPNDYLES
jgi:hypothetical protein